MQRSNDASSKRCIHRSSFAENLEEQPTEIHVLVALGYFRRTLSGVVPTASGRKVAVVDRWPMPKKPGRPYGDHDYISFQAGSYAVQKLTSAAEYPGGICVLAVFPTGCGCRSPERQLPSTDDPQYAKIERLIERTLHPYITLKAVSAKGSSAELRELVRLGYLRRAREVYFPTAYARKVAVYDTWPTEIGGPFHLKYEGGESIAFAIGTYSVSRLASAAHIDGAPCGAFDDERDEYGFVGTVKLNALGRSLFREHLLYTKVGRAGLLQLWDGRRPVNDIWSNSDTGGNDDHKDVRSGGNTVNLRSTLS